MVTGLAINSDGSAAGSGVCVAPGTIVGLGVGVASAVVAWGCAPALPPPAPEPPPVPDPVAALLAPVSEALESSGRRAGVAASKRYQQDYRYHDAERRTERRYVAVHIQCSVFRCSRSFRWTADPPHSSSSIWTRPFPRNVSPMVDREADLSPPLRVGHRYAYCRHSASIQTVSIRSRLCTSAPCLPSMPCTQVRHAASVRLYHQVTTGGSSSRIPAACWTIS